MGVKSSPVLRLSRSKKFCATLAPAPVICDAGSSLADVCLVLVALVTEGDRLMVGDVVDLTEFFVPNLCA
jgi:hypothetical protein